MLRLDEALFDDDITFAEPTIKVFDEGSFANYADDLDDSIFIYEPLAGTVAPAEHKGEAVPEGPKLGVESGIADTLINLINDEWEAIQGYNNFREMILGMQQNNDGDYTAMLRVIDEVVNEENRHVGQLQELLKGVSPNTESIQAGEDEAQEQLQASGNEWVNGKLKVDFHEPVTIKDNSAPEYNAIDESCTISDADDEW